ncbi:Cyclohexadienyl dehydratase [Ralstonia sp. LMG 32965]|uniref:Cyclohexadienyl dehydratase n=2 Tax=Ralstonia flatus TaxID=3058601 RepID=A0AAD2BTW2_9RALS|nr:Cyclohexadienyl dehydratase [Ralstonia sp. LMG 32965]CAJ0857151.1 Cyclohexadienyl dehydratase [Ralstonia sp. LMG 32965]
MGATGPGDWAVALLIFQGDSMFNRFIRASALLLCACAAAPALAQTTTQATNRLDEILARGTLRVGTTGDYKPFTYKNPADGRFIGLDVEMGERLAKALGVKLEIVPTTWSTLMQDFAADRYDIAMSGVSVTLERQKKAFYSIPYQRDGKTPITRCENQSKYQTLAQIDQPNVRAVVNPGGTNEKFAREHLKQAQIRVYPDNVTIFNEIVAGRADLMMTDAVETKLQQMLHPELCAVHPEAPFDFSEKAYLLPRDVVFKNFVDQWLRQTAESGEFAKRFDAWLAYPWNAAAK